MSHNKNQFTGYSDGAHMWRDTASSYGIDEAVIICTRYLQKNLDKDYPAEEIQFCRELFLAMFEATATRTVNASLLVYPYDIKTAYERTESSFYHASNKLNITCARGIDSLITESQYKTHSYNFEMAVIRAILEYGLMRVCLLMVFNIQVKENDGRISAENRNWANTFSLSNEAFSDSWLQSHAVLVDGFCKYVRKLCQLLDVERLTLPGCAECGEHNAGYEIIRAITISDDGNGFSTGYAIGHNPGRKFPYACWQFAVRDGTRHYNWGEYGDKQIAIDAYIARVFVALYDEGRK